MGLKVMQKTQVFQELRDWQIKTTYRDNPDLQTLKVYETTIKVEISTPTLRKTVRMSGQ